MQHIHLAAIRCLVQTGYSTTKPVHDLVNAKSFDWQTGVGIYSRYFLVCPDLSHHGPAPSPGIDGQTDTGSLEFVAE